MGNEIKEKTFRVKGTSLQPYTCKFVRDGNSLRIRCDCPVGMYGEPCEHWMSIFTGEEQEYLDLGAQHPDEQRLARAREPAPHLQNTVGQRGELPARLHVFFSLCLDSVRTIRLGLTPLSTPALTNHPRHPQAYESE